MADRVIHKYQILEGHAAGTTIPMRTSSKIVLVAAQTGQSYPAVWVEHLVSELKQVTEPYTVAVHGTGNLIPDDRRKWIGSAICGPGVWHVYGWWGASDAPAGPQADAPMKEAGRN
jgi:hypothetical protein